MQRENYLDYIPKRNQLFEWELNDKGRVEILVENKGLFNRIAQIFFKKPKVSHIELEDMGSFIWQQMDGEKTVYEIGKLVKGQFKEQADPLYERLSIYLKSLHDNHFIVYVNKQKNI